jgi:alanyl-tRNA synthetase
LHWGTANAKAAKRAAAPGRNTEKVLLINHDKEVVIMNAMDIRKKFVEYFAKNGHAVISGASLIPENDPSVLFTTAGMHPLIPYLLGEPHPLGKRLVSCQKCLRTDDIDEVGDDIHLTFFEMLGNWSLGNYFKTDAIRMSYDFIVNELGLDPERLAVSVFAGDEDAPRDTEAADTWISLGIKEENIFYFGKRHNWWRPAGQTGPCGPDTEIFYDSLKVRCSDECSPACKCGKYWEIWNNVFMQYNKNSDGSFSPLSQKNIDTGLGLERMAAIMEGKDSIFETELFCDLIQSIKAAASTADEKSYRIIADHVRASCFLLADGITPGNTDQGYILRRLIRRAVRHMRKAGIDYKYLHQFGSIVISSLGELYGELKESEELILERLVQEKDKFAGTLEKGEKQFFKTLDICREQQTSIIDGKTTFRLYDTFGFPPELTAELAEENGFTVDIAGFEQMYQQHQELSRQGASQKFKGGLADNTAETSALHTATHLLHKALQIVLGDHAKQRGSNITSERLRFDFSHDRKMTAEELSRVESIVNDVITQKLPVVCREMTLNEAKELGAEGLFTDRYSDRVKVYCIGGFSKEICGGPHAENTSVLGYFRIIKEESAAAGIRRIKAVLE